MFIGPVDDGVPDIPKMYPDLSTLGTTSGLAGFLMNMRVILNLLTEACVQFTGNGDVKPVPGTPHDGVKVTVLSP